MPRFVISNLKTNKYFKMREWKEKGNINTIINAFLAENKVDASPMTEKDGRYVIDRLAELFPAEHFVLKEI